MPDSERERDRWFDRISQHLNAIGLVIGGELVVVGIITGWASQPKFANHEKIILSAIALGIVVQVLLWLRQIKRDRQIGYDRYAASLYEKHFTEEMAQKLLEGQAVDTNAISFLKYTNKATVDSAQNTKEGAWLDESIFVTIFLIFLMFLLRIWY